MSILQYPDSINAPLLQVWNNASFDNGESEDTSSAVKISWANLESVPVNQSLESDASKENQSPLSLKSSVSFKSNSSIVNPLCSKNITENSRARTSKHDEKRIDTEIEVIEKEMARLSLKLESLRLEKAEYNARRVSMRGRTVPAKFMGQKQSTKNLERTTKKFEDPLFSSPQKKLNQRGVSLGPMEICSALKSKNVKQDIVTPVQSMQSRRKSCFFRLQDIDEGKVQRKSRKSLSVSPKSRRTISRIQPPKPAAATTVGSKRSVKKEEAVLAAIQPKKLFKDGEKPVTTAKKPLKPGRVVASRYNQIGHHQSNGNLSVNNARKRTLIEDDKKESNRHEKRRASCEQIVVDSSCQNEKSKSRAKNKWEIPDEVMDFNGEIKDHLLLPKIRTVAGVGNWGESPRDSGPAKRVAELIGRKSYFSMEEEDAGDSVCQTLSFAEDDE